MIRSGKRRSGRGRELKSAGTLGGDAREVSERWQSKVIESVSSENQRYTDRRIMIHDVTQIQNFLQLRKAKVKGVWCQQDTGAIGGHRMKARKGCATVTKIMEYWLLATADGAVYTCVVWSPGKSQRQKCTLTLPNITLYFFGFCERRGDLER